MLLQRLARGGMGEIYLGQKPRGHGTRYVALKTLRQDLTRDKEYVQRFLDEARVAIILNHPAINKVFDVGFAEDTFFLELEYISGRDVRALLDRARDLEHRVPPVVAYHIADQLLDALAYLHDSKDLTGVRLNLIHRDVSPQNVMTSWKGDVTLIDFGLARFAARSTATEPGMVMGKLRYMAPEQACGHDIDQRVDVFAAGVVLYELLSGRRLYENVDPAQLWQVVAAGRALDGVQWDSLPTDAAPLIRRSLAIKREERYPTAKAFLTDLRRIAGEIKNRQSEGLARLLADLYEVDLKLEREFMDKLGRLAPFELSGEEVTHSVSLADPAAAVPAEAPSGGAFEPAMAEEHEVEIATAPGSPRPGASGGPRPNVPAPVEVRVRPGTPADISAGYGYLEEMLAPSGRAKTHAPAARSNAFEQAPTSGEWVGPTDGDGVPKLSANQLPPLKPTEATVAVEVSHPGTTAARVSPSTESAALTAPHSMHDEQTMLLGQARPTLGPTRGPPVQSGPIRGPLVQTGDTRAEWIDGDEEPAISRRAFPPWWLLAAAAIGALAIAGAIWLRPHPIATVTDANPVALATPDAAVRAVGATDSAVARRPDAAVEQRHDAATMLVPALRPTADAGDWSVRPNSKPDKRRKGDRRPPPPPVTRPPEPPVTPPQRPPEPPPIVAKVEPPVEKHDYVADARRMLRGRHLDLDDGYQLWPQLMELKGDSTGDAEKKRIVEALERDATQFKFTGGFIDRKLSRVQAYYRSVRPRLDQRSPLFRDIESQQQKMLEAYASAVASGDPEALASVNSMINLWELTVRQAASR